jgi:hypothetical protein
MARRDGNGVRLYTHNGYDFAGRFPQIVEAVAKLKVRSCFMAARPSWSMSVASQRLTCCAPGVITMLLSFVPSISSNLMAKLAQRSYRTSGLSTVHMANFLNPGHNCKQ